ncbi:DNA alkylation repair protein [Corynebacterium sp. AOP40-9SA-29]|uniref:DNA alkylation repair protein n=1 Tax=Corynebacterium sp. AOP40-9SA-29 TaxID=3457677 RepID=UPI0040343AD4
MSETNDSQAAAADTAVADVREALDALADPGVLAVNERHGDDHAVNLTKLRAVAKEAGTGRKPPVKHELALDLWATEDSACRLAATLLLRPKSLDADTLDSMLRQAGTPKVHTWLLSYVVKKSAHVDELRERWFEDADPTIASAGWALTTEKVAAWDPVTEEQAEQAGEITGLLDLIESTMADSPDTLQWSQNECLAQIGINHPDFRERAVDIGERLGVLKDYPTPKNCTSPYAPAWIAEMVSRQEAGN